MRENEKLKKYHFVVFDLNKLRQSALFSVRIEDRKYKVFVVGDFWDKIFTVFLEFSKWVEERMIKCLFGRYTLSRIDADHFFEEV